MKSFDKDGQRFVDVQTDQEQFDGLSLREMGKLATKIIKERFVGKVIGIDNRAYVKGRYAGEYGFPLNKLGDSEHQAKMRASTELDNLMDAGTNFRTEPDGRDGHFHPEATGDFQYFDVIFKVGEKNYLGVINIMPTKNGLVLKDVTKIRNITQDISGSYGENPQATFLRDVSMGNVPQGGGAVNEKFSPEDGTMAKATGALTREGLVPSSQAEMEGRGAADAESPDGGNDWRRMGSLPPESFLEGFLENEGFASWSGTDSGLVLDSYVAGALHGPTGQVCRHLNAVCKALGVRVRFVDAIPGMRNAEARIMGNEILIAKDHQHPLRFVLGHELLHRMQTLAPEQYRAFQEHVARDSGTAAQIADKLALYAGNGVELTYEGALDEIAADYAGEFFENGEVLDRFIQRHREDRTLLEKLRDAFRDLIGRLTGAEKKYARTAEGKLTAALEESARQVELGEQNAAREDGGTTYFSIEYDFQNEPYVVIKNDILAGVSQNDWVRTVKDNLRKRYPNGVCIGRNVVNVNSQSRREMTFSKYMQQLLRQAPQLYSDKLRSTDHADEILQATRNWVNEAPLHPRKDTTIDFARGKVLLRIGKNDYSAQVIVGNRGNGSLLLYDIINLTPTKIREK